ncbi:MAG: SMP-30/gluconolactonase/LRE family protein, partial [Acidimicrobiales bacterium]
MRRIVGLAVGVVAAGLGGCSGPPVPPRVVAGTGELAVVATFEDFGGYPGQMGFDAEGTLYVDGLREGGPVFVLHEGGGVREINPDGRGPSGLNPRFPNPMVVAPDGTLYVGRASGLEEEHGGVWVVPPEGDARVILGEGFRREPGDQYKLDSVPDGLALDPGSGVLYVSVGARVFRVDGDDRLKLVAGNGRKYAGDGGPA